MRGNQRHVRERHVEQTDDATIHYFITNEQSEWPISTLVMEALEDVADRPANEIEPLYDHIDPEALDQLFQPRPNGQSRENGEITFLVDEYRITIAAHESIIVKEKTSDSSHG